MGAGKTAECSGHVLGRLLDFTSSLLAMPTCVMDLF